MLKTLSKLTFLFFLFESSLCEALSLSEIVQRFYQVNPSLAAVREKQLAAEEKTKEARALLFPDLSLNGSVTHGKFSSFSMGSGAAFGALADARPTLWKGTLRLDQPLYRGGQIRQAYRLRQVQENRARIQVLGSSNSQLVSVLQLALTLHSQQREIEVLMQSQKTQNRFLKLTRIRRQKGVARAFEVAQAEADFLSFAPRLEMGRSHERSLKYQLSLLLEMDQLTPIQVDRPKPLQLKGFSSELGYAQKRHPDILGAQYNKEMASIQKHLDMGEHYPSLSLFGELGYQKVEPEKYDVGDKDSYTVGLNLKIPLFSGLSSLHTRRAAVALERASSKELSQAEINLKDQLYGAYQDLEASQKAWQQSEQWTKKANKAYELGLQSYRLGVISNVQIVQLQAGRERAELQEIKAREGYHLALIRWLAASGEDIAVYFNHSIEQKKGHS